MASPTSKEFRLITRAVSTWSLHRTLGRFVAPDSNVQGGPFMASPQGSSGLTLLELPAELQRRGYGALQICHFHLPTRTSAYLDELRTALAESNIALDALLIDDGDLTSGDDADLAEDWIGEWLEVATLLGARLARISAGTSVPSGDTVRESAERLVRLAAAHPDVRVVTENWLGMMPDADTVLALLDATGESVGLLVDLGNWSGPGKYGELSRIAPLADSCHAKCHFTKRDADSDDFRASLQILREVGYDGPMALIYDGQDDDEWAALDTEYKVVRDVFGLA
jgi:sugar phosphate isomerase/epimerase